MGDLINLDAFKKEKQQLTSKLEALAQDVESEAGKLAGEVKGFFSSHDKLFDGLISDLTKVIGRVMTLEAQQINTASTAATIATVLIEKKIVSEEEFQAIWDRDVMPQLVKAGLVQGVPATEEKKDSPLIITP